MKNLVIDLPDDCKDMSAAGKLEWYVEQSYLRDPEAWIEDRMIGPYVTVKEAYDFGFIEAGVRLKVYWQGERDSEEYPPSRQVSSIEKWGEENYVVRAGRLINSLSSKTPLYLSISTPQEQLLYAKWMQQRETED